jgi:hypothetical protein
VPRALPPYGWPVKPFDRMHPVRGYFNDPRISGGSRAFHFGIDISARDGTAVYAVEAGRVHLEGRRSLSVVSASGRAFGYWHIVPAVAHHDEVDRHERLGRIQAPWAHVHFAESRGGRYVNPLRRGALEPWVDASTPRIAGIHFFRGTHELSPLEVHGSVDIVVDAWDLPPVRVPPPWNDLPVTPAVLRWRVLRDGKAVRPWHAPSAEPLLRCLRAGYAPEPRGQAWALPLLRRAHVGDARAPERPVPRPGRGRRHLREPRRRVTPVHDSERLGRALVQSAQGERRRPPRPHEAGESPPGATGSRRRGA